MIRTFVDWENRSHTLDLDAVLVDCKSQNSVR